MEVIGIALWAAVHVPLMDASGFTQVERMAGLAELERIVREAHAAMAGLIAGMPETRDKTTAIARACGVSAGEALQRSKVAVTCDNFARARELLGRGVVSPEHLAALERVIAMAGAEDLLDVAVVQSPEEFRVTVESFRLAAEHGDDSAKRQRAQRYLRFGDGPDGMLAFRGLLPPVDGKHFREVLATLVNAKWRKDHPERARTAGGHGGDSHDQRMADALLDIAGVRPFYDTATDSNPTEQASDDDRVVGGSTPVAGTVVQTAKPAVIIVFNVDQWKATLIGKGPIPVTESLFDQTRSELYYLFENMHGEVLKFGRARHEPTAVQRLAIIARDQRCVYPECQVWADQCQIHHINEVHLDHGETDVDKMVPLCRPHHPHTHENELVVERAPDGLVDIVQRDTGELIQPGRRLRTPA